MKKNLQLAKCNGAYERGDLFEQLNGQSRPLFGYFLKVTLVDRNA